MKKKQQFKGSVCLKSSEKTIKVKVEERKPHPIYRKVCRFTKYFLAHDENSEANIGDTVVIENCRPISKTKRFRLINIVRLNKKDV